MPAYRVPRERTQVEYRVSNSRFYGVIGRADTVAEAKAFIQAARDEMPDASHHVYAFKVGYGASVTEGMSDDGEPSGTAGPPALAALRGADLGDVVLVIVRYFGGTKLGTGGLVHAYGQTAREALAALPTEEKVVRKTIGLEVPYHLYERVKLLLQNYDVLPESEDFDAEVLLVLRVAEDDLPALATALLDLSSGQLKPTLLEN